MIHAADKNAGISVLDAHRSSSVAKCKLPQQDANCLNKVSILTLYVVNASSLSCHIRKRPRTSTYTEVNNALHDWYLLVLLVTSKSIYPGEPELAEKVREITAHLRVAGFKGRNGWLKKWKKGTM